MASKLDKNVPFDIARYLFCIAVALIILIPLYIGVMGGFKSMGQLIADPIGLPIPFETSQYTDLIVGKSGFFWPQLLSSILIAVLTVALELVVCVGAAFAFARIHFRLKSVLFNYFLLGLLFPLVVAILPIYLQIRGLGLLDNYLGVVLPQVAFQIPLSIMLLRSFFVAIPRDLEDACSIDGYGPVSFLVRIVLPLSTPILATVSVLMLVVSWNNFFLPLLVFNEPTMYSLPLGVMNFQGQYGSSWNLILAFLTLAAIPAVVLFILAQKYIVAGLTAGAVKG